MSASATVIDSRSGTDVIPVSSGPNLPPGEFSGQWRYDVSRRYIWTGSAWVRWRLGSRPPVPAQRARGGRAASANVTNVSWWRWDIPAVDGQPVFRPGGRTPAANEYPTLPPPSGSPSGGPAGGTSAGVGSSSGCRGLITREERQRALAELDNAGISTLDPGGIRWLRGPRATSQRYVRDQIEQTGNLGTFAAVVGRRSGAPGGVVRFGYGRRAIWNTLLQRWEEQPSTPVRLAEEGYVAYPCDTVIAAAIEDGKAGLANVRRGYIDQHPPGSPRVYGGGYNSSVRGRDKDAPDDNASGASGGDTVVIDNRGGTTTDSGGSGSSGSGSTNSGSNGSGSSTGAGTGRGSTGRGSTGWGFPTTTSDRSAQSGASGDAAGGDSSDSSTGDASASGVSPLLVIGGIGAAFLFLGT